MSSNFFTFVPENNTEFTQGILYYFGETSDLPGNGTSNNIGNYITNPSIISNWDVSLVDDMSYAFLNRTDFNVDISKWNVSNVTNMVSMFEGATNFNSALYYYIDTDKYIWDVSNVTNMSSMFDGATNFNQDISDWDVSIVTNMQNMFNGATYFNQNISSWKIQNVTNMINMFNGASTFEQNIRNWPVTSGISITNMFLNADAMSTIYGSIDGYGNTPTIETFFNVFTPLTNDDFYNGLSYYFNILDSTYPSYTNEYSVRDITRWNVSNVTDMSFAFTNENTFNANISNWDVSNVQNMANMFNGATNFNQNISNWNILSVTNMASMFNGATSFNQPIRKWPVTIDTNVDFMFSDATNMITTYGATLDYINNTLILDTTTGTPDILTFFNIFTPLTTDIFIQGITYYFNINITSLPPNTTNLMIGSDLFYFEQISRWDVSNITDMSNAFAGMTFTGDISNWDISSVTNMSNMFNGANFSFDISLWDVIDVTNMSNMFQDAINFNQNISVWDVRNVTNMSNMFNGATTFNQNIRNWLVTTGINVTDMFLNADMMNTTYGSIEGNGYNDTPTIGTFFNIFTPLSNIDFYTGLSYYFGSASTYPNYTNENSVLDITRWNVSNITNMSNAFLGAELFNQDISGWDVSHVTNMTNMFGGATSFDQNITNWVVLEPTEVTNMFLGATAMDTSYTGTPGYSSTPEYSFFNMGASCFIGTTNVLMGNGTYKMIKEINKGEYIIEDKITKKINIVKRVYKYYCIGKCYKIKKGSIIENTEDIISTDHPIWVNNDMNRIFPSNIPGVEHININDYIYDIQYETDGTFYINNGNIKVDSLPPNAPNYRLPFKLYNNKNNYIYQEFVHEDDEWRNKPKMIDNLCLL